MELKQTHLYQEIHEQPQVLATLLKEETSQIEELVAAINKLQLRHVVIAARGTSDNAGRYAKYLLGAVNRTVVGLATPSLFTIYNQPPDLSDCLVLGISQSGKSPDIVGVLAEAHRQGALTAAITNIPDSDLAQEADHVIQLHAGTERSVAATKTYTSELLAISLLSATLADDNNMLAALYDLPAAVEAALSLNEDVAAIVPRYLYMRDCVIIGRGYNYATAFELALKMKELTYTIVEPYSSADFLHGPMALIEHGFPAITIAPSGKMAGEMVSFMQTMAQHGAEVLAIGDNPDVLQHAQLSLKLPVPMPEWLSPITAIIPGQLLAMHLAAIRNYDPDKPRSLSKVTETR